MIETKEDAIKHIKKVEKDFKSIIDKLHNYEEEEIFAQLREIGITKEQFCKSNSMNKSRIEKLKKKFGITSSDLVG